MAGVIVNEQKEAPRSLKAQEECLSYAVTSIGLFDCKDNYLVKFPERPKVYGLREQKKRIDSRKRITYLLRILAIIE